MGLIAIGDIHGCVKTLDALIDQLAPWPDDHLVFIGDYIDRGPDSRGVIDRLIRLREEYTCTFLRGNHEALMFDCIDRADCSTWLYNGGEKTLESYRLDSLPPRISDAHIDFLRSTQLYLDTDAFFFVHGGLKANLTIEENLHRFGSEVFLWERSHLNETEFAWEKTVVCGHTPRQKPIDQPKLINLDTGCVYFDHEGFGNLTAVRLPQRAFVSVRYRG